MTDHIHYFGIYMNLYKLRITGFASRTFASIIVLVPHGLICQKFIVANFLVTALEFRI